MQLLAEYPCPNFELGARMDRYLSLVRSHGHNVPGNHVYEMHAYAKSLVCKELGTLGFKMMPNDMMRRIDQGPYGFKIFETDEDCDEFMDQFTNDSSRNLLEDEKKHWRYNYIFDTTRPPNIPDSRGKGNDRQQIIAILGTILGLLQLRDSLKKMKILCIGMGLVKEGIFILSD